MSPVSVIMAGDRTWAKLVVPWRRTPQKAPSHLVLGGHMAAEGCQITLGAPSCGTSHLPAAHRADRALEIKRAMEDERARAPGGPIYPADSAASRRQELTPLPHEDHEARIAGARAPIVRVPRITTREFLCRDRNS
jgi:hypothetical protein